MIVYPTKGSMYEVGAKAVVIPIFDMSKKDLLKKHRSPSTVLTLVKYLEDGRLHVGDILDLREPSTGLTILYAYLGRATSAVPKESIDAVIDNLRPWVRTFDVLAMATRVSFPWDHFKTTIERVFNNEKSTIYIYAPVRQDNAGETE